MGRTQGVQKQGVQKHNDYYKSERERLEAVQLRLRQQQAALETANSHMLEKLQVLASLVIHQETLAKLLHNLHVGGSSDSSSSSSQARHAPPEAATPFPDIKAHTVGAGGQPQHAAATVTIPTADATTAAAAAAARGRGGPSSSDSPHLSYCYRLLYEATPEQWQRAANMSAQDWCEYYSTICARLTLYKSMLARHLAQQQQQDDAAAAAAACAGLGGAAGGAAAGGSASSAAAAMQQLVDDFLTLVMLTLTCNTTMAYRQASQVDMSTGRVVDHPPPNHWQRVIAGSNLSPAQESQLLTAFSYFVRQRSFLQARQQVNSCQLAAAIERTQHTLSTNFAAGGSFTGSSSSSSQSSGTGAALAAPAPAAAKASAAASPAAADDAEAAGERLIGKFNAVLSGIDGANCVLLVAIMDVLTPPQRLHWVLAPYPFLPRLGALLEALNLTQKAAQAQQQAAEQAQQQTAVQAEQQTAVQAEQKAVLQQQQQLQQVAKTQQQAQQLQQRQQQQQHVRCTSSSETGSMVDTTGLLTWPSSASRGPEPGLQEHTQQIHLRQLQLAQQHQAFWARYAPDLQQLGASKGLDVRSLLGLTG